MHSNQKMAHLRCLVDQVQGTHLVLSIVKMCVFRLSVAKKKKEKKNRMRGTKGVKTIHSQRQCTRQACPSVMLQDRVTARRARVSVCAPIHLRPTPAIFPEASQYGNVPPRFELIPAHTHSLVGRCRVRPLVLTIIIHMFRCVSLPTDLGRRAISQVKVWKVRRIPSEIRSEYGLRCQD